MGSRDHMNVYSSSVLLYLSTAGICSRANVPCVRGCVFPDLMFYQAMSTLVVSMLFIACAVEKLVAIITS